MQTPRHVSIIMDGNGRWARERGRERIYGHKTGAESIRAVIRAAVNEGIEILSLFAFSEENWGRPADEVNFLMRLLRQTIQDETDEFVKEGIRCRVLGHLERLEPSLRQAIAEAEARTAGGTRLTVVIFLSYSGQWDIFQAARKMAADLAEHPDKQLDVKDFSQYLVTAGIPDPDLIIRPSGEIRTSNFLLWQSAYSEYYFTDTLWPDFDEKELDRALIEYGKRSRRFGGA